MANEIVGASATSTPKQTATGPITPCFCLFCFVSSASGSFEAGEALAICFNGSFHPSLLCDETLHVDLLSQEEDIELVVLSSDRVLLVAELLDVAVAL